ncbi:MAG: hypothetical protein AB1921_11490 [Thermodesulfobacteriota bacterium]
MKRVSGKAQKGSITVLALLILVILTLLGVGVLTTSTSDIRAQQNRDVYRRNFSRAEAAVRAAMQTMEDVRNTPNGPADLRTHTPAWLHTLPTTGLPSPTDPNIWQPAVTQQVNLGNPNEDVRFYVVETRVVGSKSMDATQTYWYAIFGRGTELDADGHENGEVVIRVGYRMKIGPV